jgi:hypothetical protein
MKVTPAAIEQKLPTSKRVLESQAKMSGFP